MRKFNEDDIFLFESLIKQGEEILNRYDTEKEETLVNSKEFNDQYDQWRADSFRLFETHFDMKDIVFGEISRQRIFIYTKRSKSYVEIILRAMRSCYRIPYHKTAEEKAEPQILQTPVNINIHNENKQTQSQTQEFNVLVESLKNSIAPYQLDELKQLANSDSPVTEKRKSLFDKIMSFGTNVGASVLANILTKPEILAML